MQCESASECACVYAFNPFGLSKTRNALICFDIWAQDKMHFYGPKPVFRIRMDPSFFADPDPDFKNLDPDSSVFWFNKLMGSKGCSLIRFWRNLLKKDSVESVKYSFKNLSYFYLQF